MIVGTPGTGIGGLFYLLLAAWMPVRHVCGIVRGRAIPGGWKIVVSSITQGSAMLGALFGEAWVIKTHIVPWLARIAGPGAAHGSTNNSSLTALAATAPALALLPLAVLALVLLAVEVARLLGLSQRGRKLRAQRMPAPPAAAQPAVVTVKER